MDVRLESKQQSVTSERCLKSYGTEQEVLCTCAEKGVQISPEC